MLIIFYSLFIRFYYFLVLIASTFNQKASKWINGRRDTAAKLSSIKLPSQGKRIWIHCASLGEFEQARPLIERWKKLDNTSVILTFYSPSGYEIRKNYQFADVVMYLPLDTTQNAEEFLDSVKPNIIVFVKYEFWFNFLSAIKKKKIPFYLLSGIFRSEHFLFRFPGRLFLPRLKAFTHFFVQDKTSAELLAEHGFTNATVTGDTRFDRVLEIASTPLELPLIKAFKGSSFLVIAGSTWEADEKLLSELFEKDSLKRLNVKLVIAPHSIDEKRITSLLDRFPDSVKYSDGKGSDGTVLIIDNIGMLSSLYRYGEIAYVGGGFGKAVHNVLEPAAFGLPVMFGPANKKFREIQLLKEQGLGVEIHSSEEIENTLIAWRDQARLNELNKRIHSFMKENSGAVDKVYRAVNL